MSRWVAVAFTGVVVCALAAGYALLTSRDPFDKFEVVAVGSGHPSIGYPVTYRYHHANSSQDLHATWKLSEKPNIGSTLPPPGRADPLVAWTKPISVLSQEWGGARLRVFVAHGVETHQTFKECYFNGDMVPAKHRVCIDSNVVDLEFQR